MNPTLKAAPDGLSQPLADANATAGPAEPLELVDPRPAEWADRFQQLRAELQDLLEGTVTIDHIGSTAVPDLPAKDVVDVLVGVAEGQVQSTTTALHAAGFEIDGQRPQHAWLTRRVAGQRTCVIHIMKHASTDWCRRLAFRDLLRNSPGARAEYLQAKREAARNATDWTGYTSAKAPTVRRLLGES